MGIIVLFHIVGLVGLGIPFLRPLFLSIVPFHILLMLGVTLASASGDVRQLLLFALITFVLGILLEWIGVHKHWIFGDYSYGATLGTKVLNIPLTIGINWFLLVWAAGVTMQHTRIMNRHARVWLGAAILVLLDLLIEPVAIWLDYWNWREGFVPVKNYICWYLVGAAMLYIFEAFRFRKQNIAAPVLLLVEFAFFGILNIIL